MVPWTLIEGVGTGPAEYATKTEAFCGILAVVTRANGAAASRSGRDVHNETMWGTLSCNVLIDLRTGAAPAADQAIADLRYGAIGINCWSGLVYGLCSTTWGAFPGHTLEDIQSGRGTVHNTLLIDHPQKSVARAPWRMKPLALWFVDHANLYATAQRLIAFEKNPSWFKIPGIAAQAFKG